MKTSEKILLFLSSNGPCTVKGIASSLNLTKADIRYHIKLLTKSNEVTRTEDKVFATGRGRPSPRFALTNEIPKVAYSNVVMLFANYLLDNKTPAQIADEIWNYEVQSFSSSRSPIARINNVLEFLNHLGVDAVWIAGKSGPKIMIIQNPYKKENPQPFYSIVDSIILKAINYGING